MKSRRPNESQLMELAEAAEAASNGMTSEEAFDKIIEGLERRPWFNDRLWGVERWEGSEDHGEIVCPIIFLWHSPLTRHVVAVAEHDTVVKIESRFLYEDRWFYKVQPFKAEWVGLVRRLRAKIQRVKPSGWVSEVFLFTLGERAATDRT